MNIERKAVFKWLLIGGGILLLATLGVSFLLNLAVSLMEQKEAVLEVGKRIDGAGNYFTVMRLSIVVLLIFYWKEIVRWFGRVQGLNLRQVFFLKTLYPYVVGTLVLIELLGLVF
ncbi:hypothetical protein [Pseudoalteromonas rhizosphaerae]|jgi:hypothetical protein|uniref:hypothetical protein n=1 Tax=Pseudoalteromonas lipolytica TaxID=570156 RepID=UPI00214820AA